VLKRHPDNAIVQAAPSVLGLLGWLWLGRRRSSRRSAAWRLSGGLLLLTTAAGYAMARSANYAFWTATPLIAAAAADLAWRYRRLGLLAPLLAGAVVMPMGAAELAIAATKAWNSAALAITHKPPAKADKPPDDYCFNSSSYSALAAARPVGLTLGDIDFGPFVLALTPHSTLSAPYHRMTWGIMAARSVLVADADDQGLNGAEARARRLGVTYVLECPVHQINADRVGIPDNSLQANLDNGDTPDWLQPISDENAPIQVFRVRPPSPSKSAAP